MWDLLTELFGTTKQAYESAGYLGASIAGVVAVIRVYRADLVQGFLPKKAKWESLPGWGKHLLPYLLSFGSSAIAALSAGTPLLLALGQSLCAGVGSVGVHHLTKAAGKLESKLRGPEYVPGKLRKAANVIVPLPKAVRTTFKVVR